MFILGQRFLIGSSGHSFSRNASRRAHVNLSCLTEIKSCFVNLFTDVDTSVITHSIQMKKVHAFDREEL